MNKIQDIIDDYIRCTKIHLIVKETLNGFYLWRPFLQEADNCPIEVLRHRVGNEAVNYFLSLLRTEGNLRSNTTRSQYDLIYRFNNLVERSKDSISDAYLCRTMDELMIVNTSKRSNDAFYEVLFPRERVLWKEREVKQIQRYVADHYKRLLLGKQLFEEDYFKKERIRVSRLRLGPSQSHSSEQSNSAYYEPIIRLDFDKADISIIYGEREASISLQPLPKSWLIYYIIHSSPLLYSEVKSDHPTLNKYYGLCSELSKERRGRHRKEGSSLKPGLIVRKINAELSRCCTAVGLLPESILIARMGDLPGGKKQVDVPKMLLGARIEVEFPK